MLGIAACVLAIMLQAAPTTAFAQGPGPCNTFDGPGVNRFEVPAGVNQITAEVFGAEGGDVLPTTNPQFGAGGLGGGATGVVIPVTPGEILEITVGGAGFDSTGAQTPAPPPGTPGGGGAGAVGTAHTSATGGGASSIDRGASTLVIAGGGGGGAHGGAGGHGGLLGTDGTKFGSTVGTATPGQAGGAGGAGGAGSPAIQNGGSGSPGQGGRGGGDPTTLPVDGGGGGGGGFVGGGGGGTITNPGNSATGGGGGSSFDSTGTAAFQTGVETGDGRVTLSYDCSRQAPALAPCQVFDQAGTSNFVVPAGVNEIQVSAFGAQGGDFPSGVALENGTGGLGGGAVGVEVPVTPGESLQVITGGRGPDGAAGAGTTPGGSPGGAGDGGSSSQVRGAGGGGASSVLRGATTLLIAGGGGGATRGGDGGHGGAVGTDGTRRNASGVISGGGRAGGLGGAGATATGANVVSGQSGSPGQGGNGGSGAVAATNTGGGGGGGGDFGGGGGVAAPTTAGGGGGGSSESNVPGPVTFQTGAETGDGRVTIAYDCADVGITKDARLVGNDTIEYTLRVENTGPNPATGVTVTDALPDVTYLSDTCGGQAGQPWTWNVGALAVGASATCVVTVRANRSGTIDNTARVRSNQVDVNQTNNEDPATVRVPGVDLEIQKLASTNEVPPGGQVIYTLIVKNNGPDDATNVRVTDTAAAGMRLASAQPGQGQCQIQGDLTCQLGNLPANGSTQILVTADIEQNASGSLRNVAEVSSPERDTNPNNNRDERTVRVKPPPQPKVDLAITKRVSVANVAPGDQITYTLIVENNGPDQATSVTVVDTPPGGIRLVSAQPAQGSCNVGAILRCELGALPAGGQTQILLVARVTDDADGTLKNVASVTSAEEDTNPRNNQDEKSVNVSRPPNDPQPVADLRIDKRLTRSSGDSAEVRYTLEVRNLGPDAARDVEVVDTATQPLNVRSVNPSKGNCEAGPPITCSLGDLDPGERVTIKVTAKLVQAGRLRNVASTTSNGRDPTPLNNLDGAGMRVRAKLRVDKRAAERQVRAGEDIHFEIEVSNVGQVQIRDITVCDRLPSDLAYVSSDPNGSVDGSRVCWQVRRLGVGASKRFDIVANALPDGDGRTVNRVTAHAPGAGAPGAAAGVGVNTPPTDDCKRRC